MNTQTQPTITRYEDHEGTGTCSECGREGLRWVAILSTGANVGSECALKVTGRKMVSPAKLAWLASYEVVATHVDCGDTHTLYQLKGGQTTRETVNGHLTKVGGARADWTRDGWL